MNVVLEVTLAYKLAAFRVSFLLKIALISVLDNCCNIGYTWWLCFMLLCSLNENKSLKQSNKWLITNHQQTKVNFKNVGIQKTNEMILQPSIPFDTEIQLKAPGEKKLC